MNSQDNSGLFISSIAFASMSKRAQDAVLEATGLSSAFREIVSKKSIPFDEQDDGPFAMDQDFAKLFLENCSPKTKKVLQHFCSVGGSATGKEIEDALGIGSLRGVWSGLTTRIRKLTGNPKAVVIDWIWDDEKEVWDGQMHRETVKSLSGLLKA
ncbi:hypothetical protein [Parasphingorhabdus sp.]|uniref:hypothetical protein n=1 Tax=Parasphingorhabdus sp. TaxID=2709688 RepID=UPI003D2DC238